MREKVVKLWQCQRQIPQKKKNKTVFKQECILFCFCFFVFLIFYFIFLKISVCTSCSVVAVFEEHSVLVQPVSKNAFFLRASNETGALGKCKDRKLPGGGEHSHGCLVRVGGSDRWWRGEERDMSPCQKCHAWLVSVFV